MGKSKKRILSRKPVSMYMTRESALSNVHSSLRSFGVNSEAAGLISLFGLSGEELTEAGIAWEDLKALGSLVS